MCIKITSLSRSKPERKHSRNMRNKKEKCLFLKVSHFISESFIYVTSLSGLIKGTANYTGQPLFRLCRSTRLCSCFTGETCVPTATLLPLPSGLWKGPALVGKHLSSCTDAKRKSTTQQDPFHPMGLLSLPKRAGIKVQHFLLYPFLNSKSLHAQLKAHACCEAVSNCPSGAWLPFLRTPAGPS